jgi:hypothetical protein
MITIEQFIKTEEEAKNRPFIDKVPDDWKEYYFDNLINLMSNRYELGDICIGLQASNEKNRFNLSIEQLAEVAGIVEVAGYQVERRLGILYHFPCLVISWQHCKP